MWGKGHHFLHIFLILRTSLKTSHYLPKYSVFFLNLDIPKQEYFFFFFYECAAILNIVISLLHYSIPSSLLFLSVPISVCLQSISPTCYIVSCHPFLTLLVITFDHDDVQFLSCCSVCWSSVQSTKILPSSELWYSQNPTEIDGWPTLC